MRYANYTFLNDLRLYRVVFDKNEKFRMLIFLFSQSSLAFLDLLGVLLFGLLGTMVLSGGKVQSGILERLNEVVLSYNLEYRQQVYFVAIAVFLVLVARTSITSVMTRRLNLFLAQKNSKLSAELFRRILNSDKESTTKISHQEFLVGIVKGAHSFLIRQIASYFGLFVDLFLLLLLVIGLFLLNPLIAGLSIAIFGTLSITIYKFTHKRVQRLSENELNYSVQVNQRVLDVLNSSDSIKVNGKPGTFVEKMARDKLLQAKAIAELAFLPIFNKYASEIGLLLAGFGFGGVVFLLFDSNQALVLLGIFLVASLRIAPALMRIQQHILNLRSSSSSSKIFARFYETFAPSLQEERNQSCVLIPTEELSLGSISVENISVILESKKELLSDISFFIASGSKTSIIGDSGSGKSTLVDVLLGLRYPTSGSVRYGCNSGGKLGEVSTLVIGFVPQRINLIKGTIRDNVLLGRVGIKDEEIITIMKKLGLGNFLASCEHGLDTIIGVGSKLISGGEAQRIALASALISSPRILILDEGTSALDERNQRLVSDLLDKDYPGMTIISVTHRLSELSSSQQILIFENSHIKAKGTYEELSQELLKLKGLS